MAGRQPLYLDYLKNIEVIKEFMLDSSRSDDWKKVRLSALNIFFRCLLKRFADIDLTKKEWNNEKRKEIEIEGLNEIVFMKFIEQTPEKKANLMMQWANFHKATGENQEEQRKLKTLYMNYVWRVQGFLSEMNMNWKANPKKLEQIPKNGFHLNQTYEFQDVLDLYEILPIKEKLILRLMLFGGWNGKDIIKFTPNDFKPFNAYKNHEDLEIIKKYFKIEENDVYTPKYYYISKLRTKMERKQVFYLAIFQKEFIDDLKNYFNNVRHWSDDFEDEDKWNSYPHETIFSITSSQTISDNFRNYVKRGNLKPVLVKTVKKNGKKDKVIKSYVNPSYIRRLCFTRMKNIFTVKDMDILDLWSQHKAKERSVFTENYITDLIERTVKYYEAGTIQKWLYVENRGEVEEKVKELNKQNTKLKSEISKYDDLKKDFDELKQMVSNFITKAESKKQKTEIDNIKSKL